MLNPLLLAYTGIVWKDVLMAHLAAFGYVCLFVAATPAAGRRSGAWALAAVLALALAAALRQHALVLAVPGAVYTAFLLADSRAGTMGLAFVLCAVQVAYQRRDRRLCRRSRVGEKIPRTGSRLAQPRDLRPRGNRGERRRDS